MAPRELVGKLDRLDTEWRGEDVSVTGGLLDVDPLHQIYWERSGRIGGIPVLCLNNSESRRVLRQIFDASRFDLILIERRGCGSTPTAGETRNNRTQDLISDIESVRQHLGINRWIVTGQGRGATLALRYAQSYPELCQALLLTGIMLARREDQDWWWQGPEALFPDVWHAFRKGTTELGQFKRDIGMRCFSEDPNVWQPAAWDVINYEAQIADIRVNPSRMYDLHARRAYWTAHGRINMHYDLRNHFLDENALVRDLKSVRGIKTTVLHGRYDSVAPVSGGFDLSRSWPEAKFKVVPGAGHSWYEEKMYESVISQLDVLATNVVADV